MKGGHHCKTAVLALAWQLYVSPLTFTYTAASPTLLQVCLVRLEFSAALALVTGEPRPHVAAALNKHFIKPPCTRTISSKLPLARVLTIDGILYGQSLKLLLVCMPCGRCWRCRREMHYQDIILIISRLDVVM